MLKQKAEEAVKVTKMVAVMQSVGLVALTINQLSEDFIAVTQTREIQAFSAFIEITVTGCDISMLRLTLGPADPSLP